MTEIYAHGISVSSDSEEEGILRVSGFGWDNEPFTIFLREDAAEDLLWQLNFFVS